MRDEKGLERLPAYELQRSQDLKTWEPVETQLRATVSVAEEQLSVPLPTDGTQAFYRVLALLDSPTRTSKPRQGGAEVFGYGAAFAEELARIGQITPDEFAARFPPPTDYLGVDLSPKMIRQATLRRGIALVEADPKAIPFPAARYMTIVYATEVIEFTADEDEIGVMLKEGHRVARNRERFSSPSTRQVLPK